MKYPLNFLSTVTFGSCDIPTPFTVSEILPRPLSQRGHIVTCGIMPTLFYQEYDISSIYPLKHPGVTSQPVGALYDIWLQCDISSCHDRASIFSQKKVTFRPADTFSPLWQCSRKPLTNFSAKEWRTTNNTWLAHSWGAKALPRTGFCLRGMVARPLVVLTLQWNPL